MSRDLAGFARNSGETVFLKSKNQAWAGLCALLQRLGGAGSYFLELMNKAGERASENIGFLYGLMLLGNEALPNEVTAMSNVIPFNYQGERVRFNSDGWINVTDVAKRYGKRPIDWLKQDETRRYMSLLGSALNCDPESLLETRRGRYQSGTWLHPKMAVAFARWLDLEFAVWCDLHIDALLRGDIEVKRNYAAASHALVKARTKASKGAAELAPDGAGVNKGWSDSSLTGEGNYSLYCRLQAKQSSPSW